jgi:hypothetical protein
VDNTAALDAAVDVRDAHTSARDAPIHYCLRARKSTATWLSGRHDHLDVVERERQEAQILEQPAPRGQGVRCRLGVLETVSPALNAANFGAFRQGLREFRYIKGQNFKSL